MKLYKHKSLLSRIASAYVFITETNEVIASYSPMLLNFLHWICALSVSQVTKVPLSILGDLRTHLGHPSICDHNLV